VDLAGHRPPNTPKNFAFRAMPWREFVERAAGIPAGPGRAPHAPVLGPGESYYMRSVAEGRRAGKEPSDLNRLFPRLAADVRLPAGVVYAPEALHSTVLRVASPRTELATHFDTMDNALVQALGDKNVSLWPPAQAGNLYVAGSSARADDPDTADPARFPRAARARAARLEATLRPGDVLFIPALWLHRVRCESFSVAVNAFWRGLPADEHGAKDVYGNRPPVSAARALALAEQAAAALAHLPEPYRSFYGRAAAERLEEALGASGPGGEQDAAETPAADGAVG